MSDQDKQQQFLKHLKQHFDDSVNNIDAATASGIAQVRTRALKRLGNRSRQWVYLPVGAVVMACLALVVFIAMPKPTGTNGMTIEDIEMISAAEDLELLEELEFYEWLDDYGLSS